MHRPVFLLLGWMVTCWISKVLGDVDVRVGEDLRLECRFNPALMSKDPKFYWIRANQRDKDNVAIAGAPLENNYKLTLKPEEGIYDLHVSNVTYERDNGKFECRLKESGTGVDLHSHSINVTVLVPPGLPVITASHPVAVEGVPYELTCASTGGSPPPHIKWYRKGISSPLDSTEKWSSSKDVPSTGTLTFQPSKEDDGAEFRCVVFNRAITQDRKLEASTTITVNYSPRVRVGPFNPVRVERGGTATLTCQVDAKPAVSNVRWTRNGKFLSVSFNHTLNSISTDEAGVYTCSANNGLGQVGEADLQVDVMYPPVVIMEAKKEVDMGSNVIIVCNITANPAPSTVEWHKENDEDFKWSGDTLKLNRVRAEEGGKYTCTATNVISGVEKRGSASVVLHVRHAPGATFITPEEPIVAEDGSITLTCGANPPGYPVPQYRWWKQDAEVNAAVGAQYTVQNARLANEGLYYCQPSNELGVGQPASVHLRVFQPPRLVTSLPNLLQKTTGDTKMNVNCSAQGKPKPSILWTKNGQEILPTNSAYEVTNEESELRGEAFMVRSTLRFALPLTAEDRGQYACVFENSVKKVETVMNLKIQHPPLLLNHRDRFASSLGKSAMVTCKIQAYPRPSFEWRRQDEQVIPDGLKYDTNITTLDNDVYIMNLRILSLVEADYGSYMCKAWNSEGEIAGEVKLQALSIPDTPTNLQVIGKSHDHVTLTWEENFNGGYDNTVYNVRYFFRNDMETIAREYDCQQRNPCNVTGLEQLTNYTFQVKATNNKGDSAFSVPASVSTAMDFSRLPIPNRVELETKTRLLSFVIDKPGASLVVPLVAVVDVPVEDESHEKQDLGTSMWRTAQRLSVQGAHNKHVLDEVPEHFQELRLRICLEANETICSPSVSVVTVDFLPVESTHQDLPMKYLIAIVVSCVLGAVLVLLIFVYCFCRSRRQKKIRKALEYEKTQSTRSIVAHQPPPPYYAGLDNKARDASLDTSMDDTNKNNLYATQSGYGYHNPMPTAHAPGEYLGVNMAYNDHSYSNSNNGGSVNSQDSLWQVKANADNAAYPYDPMTHGGYGGFEDYSHYPPTDDYINQRNRDYAAASGDPYAAVHKGPKRMDHLGESAYHNVSGLPDPYMDPEGEENKTQHVSMSFDESLESGYSTPNSRNRRVIREIIV